MQVHDKFECTFIVSTEVWQTFVDVFGDRNPLHVDAAAAKAAGFAGRVMHGNILGGFISFFVGQRLPRADVMILSQSIKYAQPVYLGDRLEFSATVTDVFESVNAVELRYQFARSQVVVAKGTLRIGFTDRRAHTADQV